jgi:hypothetical protein
MEFDPPAGSPGTRVVGRTGGNGAMASSSEGQAFSAYLVQAASRVRTPIGHVRVDAKGNGTLRFVIPEVAPGSYTVRMYCPTCTIPSTGSDDPVVVGRFRVVGGRDSSPSVAQPREATDGGAPRDRTLEPIAGLGLLLAAVTLILLKRRRSAVV